jgi:hypothetical protein
MADTWITDISHFLDEEGEIVPGPPRVRKLAEYLTSIIVMASDIVWMCPVCGDHGLISNWRGTIWDMSGAEGVHWLYGHPVGVRP